MGYSGNQSITLVRINLFRPQKRAGSKNAIFGIALPGRGFHFGVFSAIFSLSHRESFVVENMEENQFRLSIILIEMWDRDGK